MTVGYGLSLRGHGRGHIDYLCHRYAQRRHEAKRGKVPASDDVWINSGPVYGADDIVCASTSSFLFNGFGRGIFHHHESGTYPIDYPQGNYGTSYGSLFVGPVRSYAPRSAWSRLGGLINWSWECGVNLWSDFTVDCELDPLRVSRYP